MEPQSLVQLVASGNTSTVEAEWLGVFASADVPLEKLTSYQDVLAELRRFDRTAMAADLAWAAIESLSERYSPAETLTIAGPFLLAIGEHDELRGQVSDLYRTVYAEREGFETLLDESGLPGGRPVRRALRTLDVCLALEVGSYLSGRDADRAARVDAVDPSTWEFTIAVNGSQEILGPVELADAYQPAEPTEFRVMRDFAASELLKRLQDDPAGVVVGMCRRHGGKIDSDQLESLLVPDLFSENEWKKWWSRARTALKQSPNTTLEGRAPYTITYHERAITPEEEFLAEFETLRDPDKRIALAEQYLRDCNTRRAEPSREALERCHERFRHQAQRLTKQEAVGAVAAWVATAWVGEHAGIEDAAQEAINLLRRAPDLPAVFRKIEGETLYDRACHYLSEARPDDWIERLTEMLPTFPLASCNPAARRLAAAGRGAEEFDGIVQQILASPVECFEALLWLWDGPAPELPLSNVPLVTILTRILRTMEDARLSDDVAHETHRTICGRARSVLAARKYERFIACISGLEPSMARTLRRQIARGEGLGLRVRDDLIREIDRRVPPVVNVTEIPPWEQEDVLYVTKAGMMKKQTEIEQHVNVKMAENAKAIGRAAERGDLSENSEYKFALEERDLLRARLAQMNEEVARAQVIDPEDVPTDHVGIGTRVVFRPVEGGEPYSMTFGGPWEANLDESWFNYKAPLARSLMGRRVGDVVEFNHSGIEGKFEIVSLHNALAD